MPLKPSAADVAHRLKKLGVHWDGETQFVEMRKGAIVISRRADKKLHNEPPHPAVTENPRSDDPCMLRYVDGRAEDEEDTPPMTP